MKKLLIVVMMVVLTTMSYAQDYLIKDAKSLLSSGYINRAAATITPALTSHETKDKAAAWNLMNDIQYKIFSDEYQEILMNPRADMMNAVTAFLEGFKAATECDKYDTRHQYRKNNARRYFNERHLMHNIGAMCYQRKNMKGAIKAWEAYIETGESSIYDGSKMAPDTLIADVAYNSAYLSYMEKDYDNALRLAEKAYNYPDSKKESCLDLILYTMKDKCTNHADSLVYLARLKEAHKAMPERDTYFNLLQDYYVRANDTEALMNWAKEETQINANNKMAWALLGEAEMNSEHWDEAITAFKKAADIDPSWVPVVFNTGICYNSKAIVMNDELTDKKTMRISNENAEKVKDVLRQAMIYLEKTKELDPKHEQARWPYPLYRIYYTLGMKDKMAELEAIVPELNEEYTPRESTTQIPPRESSTQNPPRESATQRTEDDIQIDASGTGFLIDKRGYLATNYHVTEDAKNIYVCLQKNGEWNMYYAVVVKNDPINDLSIVRINDADFKPLPSLPYNFTTEVADVASEIYTLGYPQVQIMGTEVKYTVGVINSKSGIQGDPTHYQISAHIDHGNSGGPMFNSKGAIIGITDSGLDKAEFGDVNYAIKSSYLKALVDALPISLELPHDPSIARLSRVEQIKVISKYTALILIDLP